MCSSVLINCKRFTESSELGWSCYLRIEIKDIRDSEDLLLQNDTSYINEKIIAIMGNADISGEWDDSFGEIINMRLYVCEIAQEY